MTIVFVLLLVTGTYGEDQTFTCGVYSNASKVAAAEERLHRMIVDKLKRCDQIREKGKPFSSDDLDFLCRYANMEEGWKTEVIPCYRNAEITNLDEFLIS